MARVEDGAFPESLLRETYPSNSPDFKEPVVSSFDELR
jgi:hypothetical protein